MSTISGRTSTDDEKGSVEQRLTRVVDTTDLAAVVPHLSAETLHQLVQVRGLEAAGELLVVATPPQLAALADLDLWQRPVPGRDERFDVARFGEWIETLVDVGPAEAARTVAALDTALAVEGLSRYVRVLDPGIFEPTAQSDDEAMARADAMREGDALGVAADDRHDERVDGEIGGYVVRPRRRDAWEAIVELLAAMHAQQAPAFHRLMHGCRALSYSRPEIDGLDDLLPAPEQHAFDLDVARETRRTAQGYATPADARAFLQLARQGASNATNPIAAVYLREPVDADASAPPATVPVDPATADAIAMLAALAAEAAAAPRVTRARLSAGDSPARDTAPRLLTHLMACARDRHAGAFHERTRELAFLANALAAGCAVRGRAFTAAEASNAASCTCNLGLENAETPHDGWLIEHSLITAFERGWSMLYREVSLAGADRLVEVLGDLRGDDAELQRGLVALARLVARHRASGLPWLARGRLDVLAMLDPVAAVAVQALLGECPVVAAALTAAIDGSASAVDPAAGDFIATRAQMGDIRVFLRLLPDLLTR